MAIWESQNIQLVWFLSSTDEIRANDVFAALSGDEPVNYQRNKVPNPANPFLGIASGPLGAFEATLQLQPGRMDLLVLPRQNPGEQGLPEFPTIDTEAALSTALKAAERAPGHLPCVRLATVLNLVEMTKDADAARRILEEKIGYRAGFSDYSDFMFQINRRRTLGDDKSLLMNRLVRYSVGAFQSWAITNIQPGGIPTPIAREQFAASLTVDVNTVPDGRVFANSDVITIFNVMAKEALRVGHSGYVASLED